MIDVAVRRLRPDAQIPHQAYEGDAGLDLAACEALVLEPGERAVVPTGVAVEIPDGYAGFVQPRSGLAVRHGIGIVNSPGLIDSGYRGEIRVVLLNTGRDPFSVEAGNANRAARRRTRGVGPAGRGRRAGGERARVTRVRIIDELRR